MTQKNGPQHGKKIHLALVIWIALLLLTLPFLLFEKTRVYATVMVSMLISILIAVVIIGSAGMITSGSVESN